MTQTQQTQPREGDVVTGRCRPGGPEHRGVVEVVLPSVVGVVLLNKHGEPVERRVSLLRATVKPARGGAL